MRPHMKVAIRLAAASAILWLAACATDEDPVPTPPDSAATQMDPAITDPSTPSRDPLGTPPISPEDAK